MKLRQKVEQNDVIIDRLKDKVRQVGAKARLKQNKEADFGSRELKSEGW